MKIKLLSVILIAGLSPLSCLDAEELDKELSELTAQVVSAVDQANVKTIATLDFVDLQGNTSQLGRFVADEISTDLVMAKKHFTVVDRANLKKIMQENKLTVSGLVDPDNAKKLGQIAGVDAFVTGTLTPFDKTIRVAIKVIATDTAKIIGAARGQITKTPSVEKLAGGVIGSEPVAEQSQDEEGMDNAKAATQPAQTFNLGDITATVDWAKFSARERKLEVSMTFTNKTKRTLLIIPGKNAQATDDRKNRYRWTDAAGFRRGSDNLWEGFGNKFLQLDPNVPSPASFIFRLDSRDTNAQNPSNVRFFAALTIVEDRQARSAYSRTVSASIKLD